MTERRVSTLTDDDLQRIADIMTCNKCGSFTTEEAHTLKSFASNINRTQRIATWIIISGMVVSVVSGVIAAVKYYLLNVVLKGGNLK